MCGSTKYFRASTSSKYSFEPTGFCECRMLHGRASQYRRTSAIDFSVEPWGSLDGTAASRSRILTTGEDNGRAKRTRQDTSLTAMLQRRDGAARRRPRAARRTALARRTGAFPRQSARRVHPGRGWRAPPTPRPLSGAALGRKKRPPVECRACTGGMRALAEQRRRQGIEERLRGHRTRRASKRKG